MSIQALVWVIERSQARLADRCVLVSIANHCDRQGQNAWPSVDTISHEAKVSPRKVQVSLAHLSKMGELTIARNQGPRGTNLYALPLMTRSNPPLLAEIATSGSGGAESAGVQILRGESSSPGAQNQARKERNSSPEPSVNPSVEPACEFISSRTPEHVKTLPEGTAIPVPNPWSKLKERLKKIINRQSFETWFTSMQFGHAANGILFLTVPTQEWEFVREQFGDEIRKAIAELGLPYQDFALEFRLNSARQKRA